MQTEQERYIEDDKVGSLVVRVQKQKSDSKSQRSHHYHYLPLNKLLNLSRPQISLL